MRNGAGVNTSAVFGFVKFLKDLILRERPHYLGVAFDPPGGNFRHELYADYKANRSETPEDIVASVPYIKQVLEAMRIPVLEIPGYEADDVIGTLSQKAAAAGYEVFMVTPDKDYGQLIRPAVRIYKQRKGGADGIEIIGCEQIREHYGIDDPCRVIDVLRCGRRVGQYSGCTGHRREERDQARLPVRHRREPAGPYGASLGQAAGQH